MVVVMSDSVMAALSIYEMEDIFILDVYIQNFGAAPFSLSPSQVILMDGNRIMLLQLAPDEAANMYLSRVRNIPRYRPKYTYDVDTATQGYLQLYGNQATYSETSQTTVTPVEDPYNKLGYSIGSAIAASRNKKYQEWAAGVYSFGLVEGTQLPGRVGSRGAVYWRKRANWTSPLILRFTQTDYEIQFTPRH